MNYDVVNARINRATQFLLDCEKLVNTAQKRIPESRVKKLEEYRLFFNTLKDDPIFSRLAEYSLQLLDKHIEFARIYNEQGLSNELGQLADQIVDLIDANSGLMNEIEREVFSEWQRSI
ncbi:hypothetical protein [Parageobacillus thermoglucosidasius]|uniref:hypothetical protein n=1 Tax=Parageobacillus thermoglucosidasius TaxID=1426 RepID=UPI0027E63314|nr:hypothetical protein PthstB1num2_00080 [Parageobacillus thermoglucosidasius]